MEATLKKQIKLQFHTWKLLRLTSNRMKLTSVQLDLFFFHFPLLEFFHFPLLECYNANIRYDHNDCNYDNESEWFEQ